MRYQQTPTLRPAGPMRKLIVAALVLTLSLTAAPAATPPDLLNYEGVLRDASGAPEDGSFDMIFRFFSVASAGSEILVDQHLDAGTGAVTVSGGLFGVALGSGDVIDGSGAGLYTSLAEVFSDFSEVWLEIDLRQVGAGSFETLSPRVRVQSSAYAFNATRLEGRQDDEFIDTSSLPQTKIGPLEVDSTLTVDGGLRIRSGAPGDGKVLTSDASGNASWRTPSTATDSTLRPLADRLGIENPADLPFAELRPFDCDGGSTASLSLAIDGVPVAGTVTGFVGTDEISTLSRYLVSVEANGTLSNSISRDAALTLSRNGFDTTFSGIVTEFGLAGVRGGVRTYVYAIEPGLAEGARSTRQRAFFDVTSADIANTVLAGLSLPSDVAALSGINLGWEVQYNETDLSFLQRITSREGAHFYFREIASGEQVVVGATNGAFDALPGSFAYYGDQGDPGTGEEFVATFHERELLATDTFRVGTFVDSADSLFVQSDSLGAPALGQVDRYDGAVREGSGQALAHAEADAARENTRRSLHRGTGTAASFKAGHTFLLNDVDGNDFDGTYAVTRVEHYALADSANSCVSYGNAFSAIPVAVRYAPTAPVVVPRIEGLIQGKVLSTSDPDNLGRVQVALFPDLDQDDSSGWMRVATPPGRNGKTASPFGGSNGDWQGGFFVPEVDTEVLVGFVDGQPNAPIVLGSLYNPGELPPTSDTPSHEGLRLGPLGDVDGDSTVWFYNNGDSFEEFLTWDDSQDQFQLSDDLLLGRTTQDQRLLFGRGGSIVSRACDLTIEAGDSTFDDLFLRAGSGSSSHGLISLLGSSTMTLRPGNGTISFQNQFGSQIAILDGSGDLDLSGTGSMTSLNVQTTATVPTLSATTVSATTVTASADISSPSISSSGTITATGNISAGGTISATGNLDTAGNLTMDPGSAILANGQLTIGGSSLVLRLGDSSVDDAVVVGDLFLSETEKDSTIYFYENASTVGNYLRWDQVRADVCTGSGNVNSAYVWNQQNATSVNTAWLFTNDADVEAIIDDIGSMQIDNVLTQSGACDVAETFFGPEDLEPGTVVVLDPNVPEGVAMATRALDPTVAGVVSTKPGVLLNGPSADAYPLMGELDRVRDELFEVQAQIAAAAETLAPAGADDPIDAVVESPAVDDDSTISGTDERRPGDLAPLDPELENRRAVLQQQAIDLEAQLDGWRRGSVPVALVGRVPVKVSGAVQQGEYLTSSMVPGFGMALREPGPYFAVAMESSTGGERKILALIQQGWYGGPAAAGGMARTAPTDGVDAAAGTGAGGDEATATTMAPTAQAGDQGTGMPGVPSLTVHDPAGEREVFRVDGEGNVYARGSFRPAAMDLAEYFPVSESVEPGDLLVIDAEGEGELKRSAAAADSAVVGIVSSVPGVLLGHGFDRILEADDELAARYELARRTGDTETAEVTWQALIERFEQTHAAVAMTGTVPLKVDAAYGAIRPGDMLVSSPNPGHAMRAHDPRPGTIIGKALGSLESGTGLIRVVVTLR